MNFGLYVYVHALTFRMPDDADRSCVFRSPKTIDVLLDLRYTLVAEQILFPHVLTLINGQAELTFRICCDAKYVDMLPVLHHILLVDINSGLQCPYF